MSLWRCVAFSFTDWTFIDSILVLLNVYVAQIPNPAVHGLRGFLSKLRWNSSIEKQSNKCESNIADRQGQIAAIKTLLLQPVEISKSSFWDYSRYLLKYIYSETPTRNSLGDFFFQKSHRKSFQEYLLGFLQENSKILQNFLLSLPRNSSFWDALRNSF